MKIKIHYIVKLFLLILFTIQTVTIAQVVGSNMNNPVNAGIFPGAPYADTKSNITTNGFGNDMGNQSDDIFYKVTIASSGILSLATCNSTFDTYLYLLDANGKILISNDDNGFCTGSLQASLKTQVYPGTYYVVTEGYSSNSGKY